MRGSTVESLSERRKVLLSMHPVWKKMTIYRRFLEAASLYPERMFYQDGRISVSYSEALRQIRTAAAAFQHLGVKKGERVAVDLCNTFEYVCVTFALAARGAVKVPINRKDTFKQKCFVLDETDAILLVTDKTEDIRCLDQCSALKKILFLKSPCEYNCDVISWDSFIASAQDPGLSEPESEDSEFADDGTVRADDVCDIIFTSGSTGNPKGVMLTHEMLLRSAYANCLNRGFEDGRKVIITVPLFHVYGYIEGLLSILFTGGTLVCMQGKFDVGKTLTMIEKLGVNDILCVPFVMQKILEYPDLMNFRLDSLYAAYCSASYCPDWIWKEAVEKLGLSEIVTGYGMSEVSGASVQSPPEAPLDILCYSVGKVLTDYGVSDDILIEYRVVDPDTLEDVEEGELGELICRGAIVTKGYINSETSEHFTEDGWFLTGDAGRFDKDGYLIFMGRMNDSYKINGENVSPIYIDQILSGCKEIEHVETVGVPDNKLGWVGVAFIQPTKYDSITKNRIMGYCSKNLASYQVPRYYFFMDSSKWPRTPNGKVTKKLLRELAVNLLAEESGRK